MSMMVSFVLSFFPRDVLDEILNLIESVSEDFPSYSSTHRPGNLTEILKSWATLSRKVNRNLNTLSYIVLDIEKELTDAV